jgi:hypothetical protein
MIQTLWEMRDSKFTDVLKSGTEIQYTAAHELLSFCDKHSIMILPGEKVGDLFYRIGTVFYVETRL